MWSGISQARVGGEADEENRRELWISVIAFGPSPAACLDVSASAARVPGGPVLSVLGPLGKVLISNWYPERAFPRAELKFRLQMK